jgi:hypothetical protein
MFARRQQVALAGRENCSVNRDFAGSVGKDRDGARERSIPKTDPIAFIACIEQFSGKVYKGEPGSCSIANNMLACG